MSTLKIQKTVQFCDLTLAYSSIMRSVNDQQILLLVDLICFPLKLDMMSMLVLNRHLTYCIVSA